MSKERRLEPLDFFIWTVEDVGLWLELINLGSYRQFFEENGVNGEYLEGMLSLSTFTHQQNWAFIRRCDMKPQDLFTFCTSLQHIKEHCLKGYQRRPWWAFPCLFAKRNRQSRIGSLKLQGDDRSVFENTYDNVIL
ncbi:hypothetical protein QQ045_010136 [Rhodiola kirilowii]